MGTIGHILDGMSKAVSMWTLMLMIYAAMIDLKWGKWNKCHFAIYCIVFGPLWPVLFLYPFFTEYQDIIFYAGMGTSSLIISGLMLLYLKRLQILCTCGGFIFVMIYLFWCCGVASRVLLDEPFRTYGWYVFSWFAVCMLFVLF